MTDYPVSAMVDLSHQMEKSAFGCSPRQAAESGISAVNPTFGDH